MHQGLKDLNAQFIQELTDKVVGYAAYFLKEPIYCHTDLDLPCKADSLNEAILLVLAVLDTGVGAHSTDLIYCILNAPLWTRLALAMMAAINRGHLRSPNNNSTYSGSTNLNHSPDKFAIHPDLPQPHTEGGALICMVEQLMGQFDKGRNRSFPDTYNKIWTEGSKVAEKIAINRLHALAQPSATTMAEVTAKAKEDLYTNTYTNLELNFEL